MNPSDGATPEPWRSIDSCSGTLRLGGCRPLHRSGERGPCELRPAGDSDIRDALRNGLLGAPPQRVAVLGVGNPERSDDGFGPQVAHRLAGAVPGAVIDCGPAPENHLARVASLQPAVVLFVDAVHFGGRAGEMRLLRASDLRADDFSTHAASLQIAGDFLRQACGARVLLLAAQPGATDYGRDLSPEVRGAAERAAALIASALSSP